MSKELRNVLLVTALIIGSMTLYLSTNGDAYWILGLGMLALTLAGIEGFVGLLLVLAASTRPYGKALLLTSGLLLLGSLTVCSTMAL